VLLGFPKSVVVVDVEAVGRWRSQLSITPQPFSVTIRVRQRPPSGNKKPEAMRRPSLIVADQYHSTVPSAPPSSPISSLQRAYRPLKGEVLEVSQ